MARIGRRWAGWFDGQDDYVELGDLYDYMKDSFSVVLVFNKKPGDHNNNFIFGNYHGWEVGKTSFLIWYDDANGVFHYKIMRNDGGQGGIGASIEQYDLWNRNVVVVATYDGRYAKLYINGEFVGQKDFGSNSELSSSDVTFKINQNKSCLMDFYTGAVWNRTLADEEITKLSEDPFSPDNVPKDGLVSWWDFNKADWSNGILPDLSGNGNDGQINGVTPIEVLVKRGEGDLPEYDLPWSWVCDGIDDYCIVDFKNWTVKKAMSFAVWDNTYAGNWRDCIVKNHATGIGHYDADKDVWRVDAGEVGYLVDMDFEYDETLHGRGIWFYVNKVQVDDNSVAEKLFRFEVVDANSGEVIFTHDYMANQFPDDSLSGIKTAGYGFMPYGRYKLRLYSYGNVGFWIGYARMEGIHGALLCSCGSSDFKIYRYFSKIKFYVYKTDGSYLSKAFSDDIIRIFEHFVVGWSNVEQKFVGYLNGEFLEEKDDTAGLDMRGVATQIIFGSSTKTTVANRYTGEIASVMLFDRLLDDAEVSDLYSRKFVLDGLVHWWIVDENGNLVDLVTGNSYQIQGDPVIREIYDENGRLNGGVGRVVFDIIKDERGM